ncbi:hypothetical protein H4R24_001532 [Coemansia sp. RSA 988]|nr:hypothetical protein H4R24_001532 [Coemansia sp. RSA 988]
MIFVKQERVLRTSKDMLIAVHIYVQERNVAWFTDVLLQEMLQAIKPRLQEKIAECKKGAKVSSVFTNSAFRVAYYISKVNSSSQILIQEPLIKSEDEQNSAGHRDVDDGQFTYIAPRMARSALVLIPEPFDANSTIALPEILDASIE